MPNKSLMVDNSTAPWTNIGGHGAFYRVKPSNSTLPEQSADTRSPEQSADARSPEQSADARSPEKSADARSPSEENNDHKHSPITKSLLPDISCRANDSDPEKMDPTIHPKPDGTSVQPPVQRGHTIACTMNKYDPCCRGKVAAYGQPTVPSLYDMQHPGMPLPLEMAEETVYVNAKQYHGILRRRHSRAKAEIENKLVKSRKPYLHESRHQHALKRARGMGGRFAKKSGADTSKGKENELGSPLQTIEESGPEPIYDARPGKTGESPDSSRQWGNTQSGHALAMQ